MIETPVIMVNYKTYGQAIGEEALRLTKDIQKISDKSWVVCPQFTDIRDIVQRTDVPVFAQHIDPIEPGSHTGSILLDTLIDAGISGTLINHSEHRLRLSDIEMITTRCRSEDMTTVICANNPSVASAAAALGPDFVAYEPPALIGGDTSVSTAKPEVVEEAVKRVKEVDRGVEVLCGAGVKNGEDVEKALELGTKGVLLASGLVKADDPEEVIKDLESGLV